MTVRRAGVLAGVLLAVLVLGGCRFDGVRGMQLPGGAASGSDAYHVTAVFDDVMDLVPQSAVRSNDVVVGSVERIDLGKDLKAHVVMRIKRSVELPANAVASLRQTSLLGEKYVEIDAPTAVPATGRLTDGATIPDARTDQAATVEEVFSALAALLNGGGVEQLHTISVELSSAMSGREDRVRDLLTQLNTFVGGLDDHRAEIVRAIDAVDRLSTTLARQRDTLATAIDDIGPGLKVLADQRAQLTTMLTSLSRLGHVATNVIAASKQDTVANLRALQPILGNLDRAGRNLPTALELMLDYPFPKTATNGIPGDYTGLYASLDLADSIKSVLTPPSSGSPVPGLPGLPGLPTPGAPLPSPSAPGLPVPTPSLGGPLPVPTPSLPGVGGTRQGSTSADSGWTTLLLGGLGGLGGSGGSGSGGSGSGGGS